MAELDKILENPNFIPIENIKNDIPCLDENSFQLWYLYKVYNKDYLDEDELERLDTLINKLKNENVKINKYNINKLQENNELCFNK